MDGLLGGALEHGQQVFPRAEEGSVGLEEVDQGWAAGGLTGEGAVFERGCLVAEDAFTGQVVLVAEAEVVHVVCRSNNLEPTSKGTLHLLIINERDFRSTDRINYRHPLQCLPTNSVKNLKTLGFSFPDSHYEFREPLLCK